MSKTRAFYVGKDDIETQSIIAKIEQKGFNLSRVIRSLLREFANRGYNLTPEEKKEDVI